MHLRVKDQLLNETITQIKQWQKDNFHKSMMHIKEKKEIDDSFKKVCFLLFLNDLMKVIFTKTT